MFAVDWLLSVPLWIVLLITLAFLLYLYGTQPFGVWKGLGIDGPAPYPFVGNVPALFDVRVGVRVSIDQWQKKYGRIIGIYNFRTPTLVITDPEVLKQIFVKDFSNFTDRFFLGDGNLQQRNLKKGVFFEDGANWKRIRKIMSPTFSSGKLKLLTHYMNLTAERLRDNLLLCARSGKLVEAKRVYGAFTMDVICGTAFGLDTNSQKNLEGPILDNAKKMLTFEKSLQIKLSIIGAFPIVGPLYKMLGIGFFNNSSVKFFEENISALIRERKAQTDAPKYMDFLQLLLDAEADADDEIVGDKKLTTDEIVAQGIIFVIAGYETTANTLQFLSYELAKNQEVQEKLVAEILQVLGKSSEPDYDKCQHLKYMEAVINEILRMYPPFNILSRLADHDFDLNGVQIPAKSAIFVPVMNIGRDPDFYPDPDTFRPDRFFSASKDEINPITFLSFGSGPRSCIGMRLAMIEMKIALVHILRSVKLVDAKPDVLNIEDYTGILVPRTPIRLHVQEVKYGTQPFGVWKGLGIDGPAPYPFVGNIPALFDDRVGVRVSIDQWQKKYGRIIGVYFFRTPTLVITDPEVLKQIFVKDFSNFTDRFFVGDGNLQQRIVKKGVFFEDGANWKRIRKIMSPTFSSGKLKLLTHYMNLTAERLRDNLLLCARSGKLVEAKRVYGAFTMDVICGTAFGLDTNSQKDLEGPILDNAKKMMTFEKSLQIKLSIIGAFPIVGPLFKMLGIGFFNNSNVKFFEENISALIRERKAQTDAPKYMDFLQLLLDAEADADDEIVGDKKLTIDEIVAQGIIFVIAGYETTANTLQFLSYELAKNQEVQKKIVAEILQVLGKSSEPDYDKCQHLKYMEAVINEILRMYPPVHLLSRLAEHDFDLNGVQIPAKSAIMIPVMNIGRDPDFYPDPDTFRPDRFFSASKHEINPITFLPFGSGPRSCIGMRLAMIEMKIALVHILRSVKLVDAKPDMLDIEDYTGILVPRTPIRLHVQEVK